MNETPWWKLPGVWIAAAFAILVALVFGEKKRADDSDAKVAADAAAIKDASLAQQQKDVEAQLGQTNADIARLKAAQDALGKTDLTPEDVKKYWDNR